MVKSEVLIYVEKWRLYWESIGNQRHVKQDSLDEKEKGIEMESKGDMFL
jgi:hypothetical protein